MSQTFQVAFTIGAALQAGFKASIGQAVSQVNKLGKEVTALGSNKRSAEQFQAMTSKIEETRLEMVKARERARELKKELAATVRPTKTLTRQMEAAKKKSQQLKARWKEQKASLQTLKSEIEKSGISTRNLSKEQDRLTRAYDKAKAAKERLSKAMMKHEGIQNRRESLRGSLIDSVAPVAAFAMPVKAAIDFESVMADVNKVISPEAFKGMDKDILSLSAKIPMAADGLASIVASAGQAGIAKSREELIDFAKTAATMGVAFDMAGAESGEMMSKWRSGMKLNHAQAVDLADAVNHLSNNMNAQAKDLGEVIRRQGAVALSAGLTEIQVASLSAALLSGGAGPEIAATAMKNLTGALTKGAAATKSQRDAFEALGFDAEEMAVRMQENAPGAIKSVFQALKDAPKEEQSALISQLFGEESKGAITPLLKNMENLHKAFDLTSDKLKYAGSMQKEYDVRSKTTANNLALLRNQGQRLGISLGTVLLPGVNALMAPMGAVLDKAAWLAETFPTITTTVMGAGIGFATLGIAINAGAYAFTFYSGAVAKAQMVIAALRSGTILATAAEKMRTVATWGGVVAQKALNLAMSTNPIGLLIKGAMILGGAATLLYKKWEPFTKLVDGIWDKVGGFFGFGKKEADLSVKANPSTLEASTKNLAATARGNNKTSMNQQNHNTIHVSVGAGEDHQTVTRAVQDGVTNAMGGTADLLAQERRLAYE